MSRAALTRKIVKVGHLVARRRVCFRVRLETLFRPFGPPQIFTWLYWNHCESHSTQQPPPSPTPLGLASVSCFGHTWLSDENESRRLDCACEFELRHLLWNPIYFSPPLYLQSVSPMIVRSEWINASCRSSSMACTHKKEEETGGGESSTRLSCVADEGTHAKQTQTRATNTKKDTKRKKSGEKKTSVGGQWTKSAYSERCISSDICTPCRRRPAAPTYHIAGSIAYLLY